MPWVWVLIKVGQLSWAAVGLGILVPSPQIVRFDLMVLDAETEQVSMQAYDNYEDKNGFEGFRYGLPIVDAVVKRSSDGFTSAVFTRTFAKGDMQPRLPSENPFSTNFESAYFAKTDGSNDDIYDLVWGHSTSGRAG